MSFGLTLLLTFEIIVLIKVYVAIHTKLGMLKELLYKKCNERFACKPFYDKLFRSVVFLLVTAIEAYAYSIPVFFVIQGILQWFPLRG